MAVGLTTFSFSVHSALRYGSHPPWRLASASSLARAPKYARFTARIIKLSLEMSFDLIRLPPEILDLIFDVGSISYALIRLWLCGNSAMNAKLAAGVTKVQLDAENSWAFHFPSFILSLRSLRCLSIQMNEPTLDKFSEWSYIVLSLPTSLEELTLMIPHPNEDHGGSPPHLDLEQYLHLRSLRLNITTNAIISRFPPNLAVLAMPLNIAYDEPLGYRLANMPRSLQRLEEQVSFVLKGEADGPAFMRDWENAPPALEHIGLMAFPLWRPPLWSFLPKTLHTATIDPSEEPWTVEQIQSLPPVLSSVHLGYRLQGLESSHADWVSLLPANLRSLELISTEPFALSINVASLPRTLTELSSDGLNPKFLGQDGSAGAIQPVPLPWPPQLTRVFLLGCYTPTKDLSMLPNTITSLWLYLTSSITRGSHDVELDASVLPSKLTDLSLYSDSLVINGKLPSSLTTLRIRHARILPPIMDSFPTSLTDLSLHEASLEYSTIVNPWKFHHGLTSLSVSRWDWQDLRQLPSSLTSLRIGTICKLATVPLSTGVFFEAFPPSLTKLDIQYSEFGNSFKFPSQRLSSALPHLLSLSTFNAGVFPSEILRELPRKLTDLEIRLESLDEEDYPYLPPTLEYFVFYDLNIDWTTRLAEYWPLKCLFGVPLKETNFKSVLRRRVRNV